jgi:hypothetical protein
MFGAAIANYYVLPWWWGLAPSKGDSAEMALFFGVLSMFMKMPVRRLFNWWDHRK